MPRAWLAAGPSSVLEPAESPFLVPFDGVFDPVEAATRPPQGAPVGKPATKELRKVREELADLQRLLWADRSKALLVVFQARDAAGKDSTIRSVFRGVNPAGVRVTSFRAPTHTEVAHDFLWRGSLALPERGTIGVHNRSWYEEVLVVRAHPSFLGAQHVTVPDDPSVLWRQRFESMRDYEHHLARNGTTVVKLFLNVSRDEQRNRLLRRLDRDDKNWKFNPRDLKERALWDVYDEAYADALTATSRHWAPWYAIPADDKPFMRLTVARILVDTLRRMELEWPEPDPDDVADFQRCREELEAGG